MADTKITLTIPEANVDRVTDAIKGLYPIPQINTGTDEEPVMENEFTDNQWAKEKVRRLIIQIVQRYENMIAKEAANVQSDDTLIN